MKGYKTTPEAEEKVRQMIQAGYKRPAIARETGVSVATVSRIRRNVETVPAGEKKHVPDSMLQEWEKVRKQFIKSYDIPDNLWAYEAGSGRYAGVVIAHDEETARNRVAAMYSDWGDSGIDVEIFKGKAYREADKYPDILEIFYEE